MRAWSEPDVPPILLDGERVNGPRVRVHDTSSASLVDTLAPDSNTARLYVCGITPYDATHLGHANTYVTFDLLNRAWRNAGLEVRYVQNVTDVDDPLLERAAQTGQRWEDLAEKEIELFRTDMEALRVVPPDHYVSAVEAIPLVVEMVEALRAAEATYAVDDDLYFEVRRDPAFGRVSGWSTQQMVTVSAERGGDPERPGKRDPLDCLLWQAARPGEPSWESSLGRGRPGWHVECSAIARHYLGAAIDVQGGGSDLVFPHHELSASEGQVADPANPFARAYVHAGMVGLDGEKMSKSKGNLELVSRLRGLGRDPMAVRIALLRHHYRTDWEWTEPQLTEATQSLTALRDAVRRPSGAPAAPVVEEVLAALAADLDAPRALRAVEEWSLSEGTDPQAPAAVRAVADAALGLAL